MHNRVKLLIIIAFFWYAQYVFVPYSTPYLLGLKLSADFVGIIVGAYGAIQMLCRFPAGVFADLNGRHKYLIIAACSFAFLGALCRVISPDGIGFLIGNIVSGLGAALWISFIVLYVQGVEKHLLQKHMGLIFASVNGGIFIAFIISTFSYEHLGMVFLCQCALFCALAASMISLSLKEPPKEDIVPLSPLDKLAVPTLKTKILDKISVVKDKNLIFFSFLAFVQQGILQASVMSFASQKAYLVGGTHVEVGFLSIIYIITASSSAFFASSNFSIKIGARFWLYLNLVLMIAYCLIMSQTNNIYIIIALQFFAGLNGGMMFAWCNSQSLLYVDVSRRSSAIGFFQAVFGCGMTIVPIICGFAIDLSNTIDSAFYFMLALSAVTLVVTIYYFNKQTKMILN